MERKRTVKERPVPDIFWAGNVITHSSVTNVGKNIMNVTIMHSFGETNRGIDDLFGLDEQVNVRLGIDYGITDRLSVGFGRSSDEKVYDLRFKYNALRQMTDDSIPLDIAIKGGIGKTTAENQLNFSQDLNYVATVMFARKFSESLSLQVTPMFSHFNTVRKPRAGNELKNAENNHYGIGLGGQYRFNKRFALNIEYLPVIGDRNFNTNNAFSVGVDIETGGHVFQLFLASTKWHLEQYTLARNSNEFFENEFRFGFNVNRIFKIGGNR